MVAMFWSAAVDGGRGDNRGWFEELKRLAPSE
jgi:hypothetical protein